MALGPAQRSRSNWEIVVICERDEPVVQSFNEGTQPQRGVSDGDVASYKGICGLINRVEPLFFVLFMAYAQ